MTSIRAHRIRHGVLALVLCAGASRAAADSAEAMQWLLSGNCQGAGAAINDGIERNEAKAYALAGFLYASTGCVAADLPRAATYYRRAVELGDSESRAVLGVMYGLGEGVPQDYRVAYRWFTHGWSDDRKTADPAIERAGGYAMTVTQVARSRTTYPRGARGDQGTVFVTFSARTGEVTISRDSSTGPEEGRHLQDSSPFRTAILDAYAEAVRQVPKPDLAFDRDYAVEVPWTFELK